MTLFEYLAIAFSLVFSFAVMRILAGLPFAAARGRRYWIHLVVVCGHLAATVAVFWNFWSYRDVTWSFPRFLLVLANPALIYFNACALIPENASSIESWRDYYYSVRRRYFSGVAAWALVVASDASVELRMPWSHPARLVQIAWFAIGIVGATSRSERVHSVMIVCALAIGVAIALTIMIEPGSLAP